MSTPESLLEKLVPDLILSPRSLADHQQNLVKCQLHPELLIETLYRQRFPEVSHEQFILMMNDPLLINQVRDEIRVQEGLKNYVLMLREHGKRGKNGDLQSARWYLSELGLSEERRQALEAMKDGTMAYQEMIAKLSLAIGKAKDQKKLPQPIDVIAEVK